MDDLHHQMATFLDAFPLLKAKIFRKASRKPKRPDNHPYGMAFDEGYRAAWCEIKESYDRSEREVLERTEVRDE